MKTCFQFNDSRQFTSSVYTGSGVLPPQSPKMNRPRASSDSVAFFTIKSAASLAKDFDRKTFGFIYLAFIIADF
jgi:hypothetical protein